MLTTRFLLSFLGFCRASWMLRKQQGCAYQVNLTITTFQSLDLNCCWSQNHEDKHCSRQPCTAITIFTRSGNVANISVMADTRDATLTTNVPAVNGSIPDINLVFLMSDGLLTYSCDLDSVKDHDHNKNQSKMFSGFGRPEPCFANLHVTSILHCPITTTQLTPTDTPTNTIRTNTVGNTTAPKENARHTKMSTKCIILYTMMAASYIAAIITIAVETVMCCKMYERTNKFPWCKVYLKEKVFPVELKAKNVPTKEESTTMSLVQVTNLSHSHSSVTCGSEDQDQKVGYITDRNK